MDIRDFIAARLDEAHAAAEAAQEADPAPWTVAASDAASTGERSGRGAGLVIAADDTALWDCEGSSTLCMTAPTARHVARNHPARILAEIAAKRAILELHQPLTAAYGPYADMEICREGLGGEDHTYAAAWPCGTLIQLAAPDADHPDHEPGWTTS